MRQIALYFMAGFLVLIGALMYGDILISPDAVDGGPWTVVLVGISAYFFAHVP